MYDLPFVLDGFPILDRCVLRPDELGVLEEALVRGSQSAPKREILIVHGYNGAGKSWLAADFSTRHRQDFGAIFWVNCATKSQLQKSWANIARRVAEECLSEEEAGKDDESPLTDLIGWFNKKDNNRWLIIFDNVDQVGSSQSPDDFDIMEYLPTADHGSILITTTQQKLLDRLQAKSLHLKGLKFEQGRELLGYYFSNDEVTKEREKGLSISTRSQKFRSLSHKLRGSFLFQSLVGFPQADKTSIASENADLH